MSAHTPGPWAVCDRAPNDAWFVRRTIFSTWGNKRVADVSHGIEEGSEGHCNALLIAAAPDLVDALRGLMQAGNKQAAASDIYLDEFGEAIERAAAALTAAGVTP